MRIILKNADFSQNGITPEDYQIPSERVYENVIANLANSSNPDSAVSFSGWNTYFYKIPEGIKTITFVGTVESGFGGSLVKEVVYGSSLPTYVNTGRNILTDNPRQIITQTINLDDYPGTTHLMYSMNSVTCQVTYQY